jgi:hypothetical protein
MFTIENVTPLIKTIYFLLLFDFQEELQGSRKLFSEKKKSLLEKPFFALKYDLFAAVLILDLMQNWIQHSDPKNRKHRSYLKKACRCKVKSVHWETGSRCFIKGKSRY